MILVLNKYKCYVSQKPETKKCFTELIVQKIILSTTKNKLQFYCSIVGDLLYLTIYCIHFVETETQIRDLF